MTCVEYMFGSINNVYSILEDNKAALRSFGDGHRPNHLSYRPVLDITDELDA